MNLRQPREVTLMDSVASLRRDHGDSIADAAIAAVTAAVEFIRQDGHGNIQIAVKDHRVAPKVRFEHYVDVERDK